MSILIRRTRSAEEIDDVLVFRLSSMLAAGHTPHRLYVESGKISDSYDVYPSTNLFVAYQDAQVCGCARTVPFNPNDASLASHYDFRPLHQSVKGDAHLMDMVNLKGTGWPQSIFMREFLSLILLTLHADEIAHLYFVCPHEHLPTAEAMGGRSIGVVGNMPGMRGNYAPMHFSVFDYQKKWSEVVVDKEILRFREGLYKMLFAPGELLIMQGEKGGSAYLLEEGEVEILIDQEDKPLSIGKIPCGSLVGEMAMVTGEKRTATVMAVTPTVCLAYDKGPFMRMLQDSPHRMVDMFKIFAKRLTQSNQRLAQKR